MKIPYKLISCNIWKKGLTRAEKTKMFLMENSVMWLILHRRRSSPSIIPDKYLPTVLVRGSTVETQC